jgi:hypothetical protein
LIEATAARSGGRQALVPLRTSWTADTVETTVELCRDHPAWRAVPLANVRTGKLWGSTPGIEAATAWLAGSDIPGPPPDWDVGHFVAIVGTIDGDRRSLLLVRDSYPAFGWDGHHLQPPEAVASALERGDGREGGVALYVDAGDREDVERAAKEAGFDIAAWDNGTPWPPSGEEGADR